jgi:hypothetical protein
MKNVGVPERLLFSIMIIYSFLIGPLALFLLYRKNRRIHILWISPVAAVLFLLIIISFALFGEGLSNRVRKTCFTLLDEKNHSAATLGVLGFYCPIAPGHLEFSAETEVQKVFPARYESRGYALDWSSGQRLDGGWVRSRIPAVFFLRKSESRRERLKVIRSAGKLEVVNGLGAGIKELVLVDFNGQRYHSSATIAPGAKSELTLVGGKNKEDSIRDSLRNLFLNPWFNGLNSWPVGVKAGEYAAKLEHTPFLENGIGSCGKLTESSVVVGIMAPKGAR